MKYLLVVLLLSGCRGVVDKKDFDDCIEIGHECVDFARQLMSEKDSLKAIITAYRYAELKNMKVFGVDERFILVNK